MTGAAAVALATTWTWLGMVLAISFLEAPLKFRAPGITVPLGLGIGRLVFRALNIVEAVLALALTLCALLGRLPGMWTAVVAVVVLLAQLVVVRPRLARRSDAVLDGAPHAHRSHAHLVYVGLEIVKVIALVSTGVALLGDALA